MAFDTVYYTLLWIRSERKQAEVCALGDNVSNLGSKQQCQDTYDKLQTLFPRNTYQIVPLIIHTPD